MPELSRFEGMIIYMLFRDNKEHNKPHVHVYYGEYKASIGIDGELLAGKLPSKQLKMVVGWLALHEEECLLQNGEGVLFILTGTYTKKFELKMCFNL